MRRFLVLAVLAPLYAVLFAAPALAAEDQVLREIGRCDDMKELMDKAGDIARDFNFSGPDAEAVKLAAAKFQAYMAYITVRQNEMIARQLAELKAEPPQ